MNLIDVDTLKEKEQYIPCGNNLLFHGVTAATIDEMPAVDPENLPIVQELRAEVAELKDQLQNLEYWQLNRKIVLESAVQDRAAMKVMRKRCEKTIAELREELKRVMAERDAAMSFIPKTCATCKYGDYLCDWCAYDPDGDMNWEWNGKAKEDCNDQP